MFHAVASSAFTAGRVDSFEWPVLRWLPTLTLYTAWMADFVCGEGQHPKRTLPIENPRSPVKMMTLRMAEEEPNEMLG